MFKYFLKRLAQMVVTLFIVSILVFVLANFIGDPVNMLVSPKAPPEVRDQVREELGLNKPILEQYAIFVTNALKGDFGKSYIYKEDVLSLIAQRAPATLELVFVSVVLALVISIPLGVYAGAFPKRKSSTLVMGGSILGISLPSFFIGILACFLFGIVFRLFTPGNFVSYTQDWGACIAYLLFPALSIAIPRIAMTVKMLRGAILNELGQDYVRTAQSRGTSRRAILQRHVLQNALIPVITFLAVSAAEIMTGSIIIEQVFTIPGVGRLLLASISNRDFPVVQAIVVILAAWIVVVNFVADLLYQLVDPRIRLR